MVVLIVAEMDAVVHVLADAVLDVQEAAVQIVHLDVVLAVQVDVKANVLLDAVLDVQEVARAVVRENAMEIV